MRHGALRVVVPRSFGDELLDAVASVATVVPAPGLTDADLLPLLGDAHAIVSPRFSAPLAAAAPDLRLVLTPGAGTDNVDMAAVPPRVAVCNVFGHEAAIAEYALMAMLALDRELLRLDRALRQGDWGDRSPQRELRGRSVLVVGAGHIGARVAEYARALGMRVLGATRVPDESRRQALGLERLVGLDELDLVLGESDFVVLAVPLTPDTSGLLGERELAQLRPGAFLVNVARAGVVDEMALYTALAERRIGGAALDVWYRYPVADERCLPSTAPFHELDNVLLTPHLAGWTTGTVEHRWATIADNLRRLQAGEPLRNVVKPAEGW